MPKKKIGVVPYSVFDSLDTIRGEYGITMTQWSEASGLPVSRISEFRNRAPHRVFDYEKAVMLAAGIRKLTGGSILKKEMQKRIDEAETYREKAILYLLLAFDDDNDRRIKHIYENMQLLSDSRVEDKE